MPPEASSSPALELRIWGARGSYPTPVAANLGHGGNTSCIQVLAPGHNDIFLFDAGTGIHSLGRTLLADPDAPTHIHIFLTHFHWDHIQGLPGFAPLFSHRNTITFYSSHSPHELRRILHGQMAAPYFPVEFEALASTRHFHQIHEHGLIFGTPDDPNSLTIHPIPLHHPGGATGYRISRRGHTIVYATDHEHGNPAADAHLLHASANADILLYDAQYTPEIYPHRIGWGHSTWLEATRLATHANVNQLLLFHHDPHHDDATLASIVTQSQQHFPNTHAATEGSHLPLP
jgi:phosphoribosyl 1,2-cyclic phosphodiesterase